MQQIILPRNVKLLVDESAIPHDGSMERIIAMANYAETANIIVFPDVHYKEGAGFVNGTLVADRKYIYPACLGVENCGFTVAKVKSELKDELLIQGMNNYCNAKRRNYSKKEVKDIFIDCLEEDYSNRREIYDFLGVENECDLQRKAMKRFKGRILPLAMDSLGTLGGGNHFFELHKVLESKSTEFCEGDRLLLLHSDSIAVGDKINLIYSNLSELRYRKGLDRVSAVVKNRFIQIAYMMKSGLLIKDLNRVINLIYSTNDYRRVEADSRLGRELLFDHNLAYIFGQINRNEILHNWAEINDIELEVLFSHAHDNISVEKYNAVTMFIQRNGVQYIGKDPYYLLPGAMGTPAFIFENSYNGHAYYSANHGTGRFQDKHIARKMYDDVQTVNELEQSNILLFRVGNGNISEQNAHAFKNVSEISEIMSKYKLGKKVVKMVPLAVVKG